MTATCTAPTARKGVILPTMISPGVAGMASRFSIVPRSISRVSAIEVIITIVICRMIPSRPGTMLICVSPLGL